jgi:CubicO group peptidase (beta-lactamase class C family)
MTRLITLLLALVAVAMSADFQAAAESGLGPNHKSSIVERMKDLKVAGVSVAVIHDYKIDWAAGYGIAGASQKPVRTDTLFLAGSISKPVAVTGALKMIEQGKLSLDEDVNAKLKSWKVPENEFTREQKVTLRRTMSHSAGLTVHGFPGYAPGAPLPTVPQILDGKPPANTAAVRVDIVPGTINRYSGGGTTIMQLLMTDVSGKDFPALMKELVLGPAGMRHSTYDQNLSPVMRAKAAEAFQSNGTPSPGKYHVYPEMAAAGLWTTASDLALFAIEIAKSREGRSNRILSKEMVQTMLTEQKKPNGLGFALQGTAEHRRFSHGGVDYGFQALLVCSFKGDGVVIMTNSDNGMKMAEEIEHSVAEAYHWPAADDK